MSDIQKRFFDNRVLILNEDDWHVFVDNSDEVTINGSATYSWGKEYMKEKKLTKKDFEKKVKIDYQIEKVIWK